MVAHHKSFSKAARSVHVSQSAISKMIKDLETKLGVALFNRNSKYVQLTDAGEVLLAQSQPIVAAFGNIITEFESLIKQEKGQIKIGLPPITGATAFAQLLGEFKKRYPHIEIKLFEYGTKRIEHCLQEGSLDIGVIAVPTSYNNYLRVSFINDPLKVIVHPNHHLSLLDEIPLTAIAKEHFVLYSNDFRLHEEITSRCKIAGFEPNIILETTQLELMTQIVAANLGIALLPSKICAGLNQEQIKSISLSDPKIYLQLEIIWKQDRYLSYAAELWLKFIQNYLAVMS
jgi:DNA-binding transcriptional LysR family regulator